MKQMEEIIEVISHADGLLFDEIFEAVRKRHAALFPDWALFVFSLPKNCSRNEQLDRMIALLEKLKI